MPVTHNSAFLQHGFSCTLSAPVSATPVATVFLAGICRFPCLPMETISPSLCLPYLVASQGFPPPAAPFPEHPVNPEEVCASTRGLGTADSRLVLLSVLPACLTRGSYYFSWGVWLGRGRRNTILLGEETQFDISINYSSTIILTVLTVHDWSTWKNVSPCPEGLWEIFSCSKHILVLPLLFYLCII